MISIIDYGLGNVDAIANIYKRLNIPVSFAHAAADVSAAGKIILPGVGSFDRAMTRLNQSGMKDALDAAVVARGTPVLGICVGMQMMAKRSCEGVLDGLGWIEGEVRKFDFSGGPRAPLPHMGWNDVEPRRSGDLFRNLDVAARFYFLHSYYFSARDDSNVLAVTDYNGVYASSVSSGNVFGVQFHPEKSHQWGIQLLKNFAEL
jgi:glutamine amidotransferase